MFCKLTHACVLLRALPGAEIDFTIDFFDKVSQNASALNADDTCLITNESFTLLIKAYPF